MLDYSSFIKQSGYSLLIYLNKKVPKNAIS